MFETQKYYSIIFKVLQIASILLSQKKNILPNKYCTFAP